MVRNNHCNYSKYSRFLKEAGIEYYQMEKYKWEISQEKGYDVGREAFIEWADEYGYDLQEKLRSLSDEEIDRKFSELPGRIKEKVKSKIDNIS